MSLVKVLDSLRVNKDFMSQVVSWNRLPARPAETVTMPDFLDPRLVKALESREISSLYTHQHTAILAAAAGHNVVVSTATASGKSLCYTVPVVNQLLADPSARALYLFPTKALAHDQLSETQELIKSVTLPLEVHAYDGDTPKSQRTTVRRAGGILISNPDMLHAGILPQHTSWRSLFTALRIVVLDEIHVYRGVFGSHVSNVLRRLRRICHFYGADPIFICCSATIANPKEHAEKLVELPFKSVDESQNGAPTGEKQFILYNPPMIDPDLGMRRSALLEAKDIASTFLTQDIQTVVFARARQTVELLLTYLRDEFLEKSGEPSSIAGYRGGYLPLERRRIESGLRDGSIRGVVATNALELGIDIGQLGAAVLTGYPGSIASTWQQAGRAGRRVRKSAVVLVAGAGPLDQYICQHPRFIFGRSPENALCNPDNIRILAQHLGCAAYELPFQANESFGAFGPVEELVESLRQDGLLHKAGDQYHWLGTNPPNREVSLRTSGNDTVVIQDISGSGPEIIGELDLESVHLLLYEGAIYIHQASSFLVETLDWEAKIANVRPVDVDYYTRSSVGSTIRKLDAQEELVIDDLLLGFGGVLVITKATGFRKIKRYTYETLGFGQIELPEIELDTDGFWLVFGETITEKLIQAGILVRPNEYGPNWNMQRRMVLERDNNRCRTCGAEARPGNGLHVHHIRPFREYAYVPGKNEAYQQANDIENLVTLCPSCHRRADTNQGTRSALGGLAYVLANIAPLFLMCAPGDIQLSAEIRNPLTRLPTVVIYERVSAGVGFSQRLFELHDQLLGSALELVNGCLCRDGCPACVGPPSDIGPDTRQVTRKLLEILIESRTAADVTDNHSGREPAVRK